VLRARRQARAGDTQAALHWAVLQAQPSAALEGKSAKEHNMLAHFSTSYASENLPIAARKRGLKTGQIAFRKL
jgi:hypothetical protein